LRVLYLTLAVIAADQLSKLAVKGIKLDLLGINLNGMPYGSSRNVFGNFTRITFVENPGMAFGSQLIPRPLLIIFVLLASSVMFYYIYKNRAQNFKLRLALSFILAGALGNLLDRIFYGYIYKYAPFFYGKVVDFIQVECWDFTFLGRTYTTWPIMNVADLSVTAGFALLILFHKQIFKPAEIQESIPGTEALEKETFKLS
jgi:signal peptidase II